MQWDRYQTVRQWAAGFKYLIQLCGEEVSKLQLLMKLETGDATFNVALITIEAEAVISDWWMLQTAAANLRRFQRHRTALTGRPQQR